MKVMNAVTKRRFGLKQIFDNDKGTTYLLPNRRVALKKLILIQEATGASHLSVQVNSDGRLQLFIAKTPYTE